MFKPRVYVETTIPSFYHTTRGDAASVARREWTRRWWHDASTKYEIVTSQAVLDELADGAYASRTDAESLLADVPVLEITHTLVDIVETYIRNRLMPADTKGDALHLAIASYHRCDFLATWNCQHLANANKFGHIRRVNSRLGLFVPTLVTPLELLGEDADETA
jgi:hypothetical protein